MRRQLRKIVAVALCLTLTLTGIDYPATRAEEKQDEFEPCVFSDIPEAMSADDTLEESMVIRLDNEQDALNQIRYLEDFDNHYVYGDMLMSDFYYLARLAPDTLIC